MCDILINWYGGKTPSASFRNALSLLLLYSTPPSSQKEAIVKGGGGGGKEVILSMGDGERGVLRENKKERETATLSWNWGFARES